MSIDNVDDYAQIGPELLSLPDELLGHVMSFLSVVDLTAWRLTCKQLLRVPGETLLWRRHCLARRYWSDRHDVETLVAAPPTTVHWKSLLAERTALERHVLSEFNELLSAKTLRVERGLTIIAAGYDAKDVLLEQAHADSEADDVLARRYWAFELLGSIERAQGIKVWADVAQGKPVPLEQVLAVFDLFIAQKPPVTLSEVSQHFDLLVERFKASSLGDDFADASSESQKSSLLIDWLLENDYTGLSFDVAFRNLQNSLITVALFDRSHPSLPIISAVIFCCMAQRLGIDARPCMYPNQVLAVVKPKEGYPHSDQGLDPIYFNPFESSTQLHLETMRRQLSAWGIRPADAFEQFLSPATSLAIAQRCARNIRESIGQARNPVKVLSEVAEEDMAILGTSPPETVLMPNRAANAVAWSRWMLREPAVHSGRNLFEQEVAAIAQCTHSLFPTDVQLMQKYVISQHPSEAIRNNLAASVANKILLEDSEPVKVQRRTTLSAADAQKVAFKVGQVFVHRRYQYVAAIVGWDLVCEASPQWVQLMRVDQLPNGAEQPFYNVVVADDESTRYVAHENISPIFPDAMPEGLEFIAGRFFKRWDGKQKCFVSNVRDEYPDD